MSACLFPIPPSHPPTIALPEREIVRESSKHNSFVQFSRVYSDVFYWPDHLTVCSTLTFFHNLLDTCLQAALAPIIAALAVQGRTGAVQMFSEGDIGVLPPLGVYDPLGLIETRDMRRYEIMEIKHGRAAMLGFLHIIAIEAGIRVPGYLSVSQDLKFSDVPAGCFASLEAVPTAGWLQIMVCRLGIQIKL